MTAHPKTGRHYVAVIPRQRGSFVDIHACYSQLASELSWLSVIDPSEFMIEMGLVLDREVMFVHWAPSLIDPTLIPNDRRALILPVYSEALDPDHELMLSDHLRDWQRFVWARGCFDGFFAHTPWMVSQISRVIKRKGFVLPVGWGPAMGSPDWECPKTCNTLFAGSLIERRNTILPMLADSLSLDLCWGVYGRALIERMNAAKTTLYIAHSEVYSYSTWRIWQAMRSSSALVTEPGDWWPLTAETCIELPRITVENVDEVAKMIRDVSYEDALSKASALHESLMSFTTLFCLEHHIVEATEGLTR